MSSPQARRSASPIDIIRCAGAAPAGVLLALDRQERGSAGLSAVQEVRDQFGIPVVAVICLAELLQYMQEHRPAAEISSMQAYRERYGV